MRIAWKLTAQRNYYKAQDYRYTMFKQADSKRIHPKQLVAQIRERHNNLDIKKKNLQI